MKINQSQLTLKNSVFSAEASDLGFKAGDAWPDSFTVVMNIGSEVLFDKPDAHYETPFMDEQFGDLLYVDYHNVDRILRIWND